MNRTETINSALNFGPIANYVLDWYTPLPLWARVAIGVGIGAGLSYLMFWLIPRD